MSKERTLRLIDQRDYAPAGRQGSLFDRRGLPIDKPQKPGRTAALVSLNRLDGMANHGLELLRRALARVGEIKSRDGGGIQRSQAHGPVPPQMRAWRLWSSARHRKARIAMGATSEDAAPIGKHYSVESNVCSIPTQ